MFKLSLMSLCTVYSIYMVCALPVKLQIKTKKNVGLYLTTWTMAIFMFVSRHVNSAV